MSGLPSFYEAPDEVLEVQFWTPFLAFTQQHRNLGPDAMCKKWKSTPEGAATTQSVRVGRFVAFIIEFMDTRPAVVLTFLKEYYTRDAVIPDLADKVANAGVRS